MSFTAQIKYKPTCELASPEFPGVLIRLKDEVVILSVKSV